MIIKINLSSKPFYNRALTYTLYIVLIISALGYSFYNGVYLIDYLKRSKSLEAKIAQHRRGFQRAENTVNAVLKQVERSRIKKKGKEIVFANSLISRRMFSWSEMLNSLEKLLPPQVMMISVSPRLLKDRIKVELSVASDYYEEILRFIKNLEESPDFSGIYPIREMKEQEETGMITLVMEGDYHPKK